VQSELGQLIKGIKTILTERNKHLDSKGKNLKLLCVWCKNKVTEREEAVRNGTIDQLCCATYVLSQEPDFMEQEEWLSEEVKAAGHKIIFFPKYHCELNFIEMIWGWLKSYFRRNCQYNYNSLKNSLPVVIKEKLPICFVRRASQHCLRFMSGYRMGLDGPKLDYAMKKYTSHRRIPLGIADNIESDFKEYCNKKLKK
jgi:hypothetical protein